jgi:hypothetical protein
MLNSASDTLVKHTKNRNVIKYKINIDNDNFIHFQCIECTIFKIEFPYLYA